MVETETRRAELAAQAAELEALEAELSSALKGAIERKSKEHARHRAELRKIDEYHDRVVEPISSKVRRARAAVSELKAHHVPRELVTAESNARSRVSRLVKGVEARRADLERGRATIKRFKGSSEEGDQLKRDLEAAEAELSANVAELEDAQSEWTEARAQLDAALAAALRVGK